MAGFKDLGTTDAAGGVAAVRLQVEVGLPVVSIAVRRSGLGTRHRCSLSKDTPTVTALAMERRVSHSNDD